MREGLGEKFGVVFSFAVVVTDTELLLTLPDNQPILQLCPNTFPKTLDREREADAPPTLTPWHMQDRWKPHYES
jgi:hypothetical protein